MVTTNTNEKNKIQETDHPQIQMFVPFEDLL